MKMIVDYSENVHLMSGMHSHSIMNVPFEYEPWGYPAVGVIKGSLREFFFFGNQDTVESTVAS